MLRMRHHGFAHIMPSVSLLLRRRQAVKPGVIRLCAGGLQGAQVVLKDSRKGLYIQNEISYRASGAEETGQERKPNQLAENNT